MGIRAKITIFFLAFSLAGVYLLGFVAYELTRNHVTASKIKELRAIVSTNQHNLHHVAIAWNDRVNLLTSRTRLRAALAQYIDAPAEGLLAEINTILLDGFKTMRNARQISVCDLSGRLITQIGAKGSEARPCEKNRNLVSDSPSLDEFWTDPVNHRLYTRLTGALSYRGELIAHAQIVFDAIEFTDTTQAYTGLGESGEVLVAEASTDGSARYLTPLLFQSNPGLTFTLPRGQHNVPMNSALMNRKTAFVDQQTVDYRGEPVFAVSGYVPEYGWGIVAKIDRKEALKPVHTLMRTVIYALVALSVLMIITGLYFGQLIAGPIVQLNSVVRRIAQGDLNHEVDIVSHDEIGNLAENFNEMTRALRVRTAEIEDARERINAVVETTVDGIITIDEQGIVETFNKACEHLFGYEAKEVIGKNVSLLMPDPHRKAHDGYLENYRRTGRAGIIGIGRELEGLRKDGSVFAMELAVSVVNLKDKRLFCGIVRDISERHAAARRLDDAMSSLRASNDDLERFAHAASHDLKAPLQAMGTLVTVLEEDLGPSIDGEGRYLMQQMRSKLQRMQRLVDDLLTYAKLDTSPVVKEVVSARELVCDVVDLLDVPERMTVQLADSLETMHVYRVPLMQVFHNLIGNAIKHHDSGCGVIVVNGIREGDIIEFSVSDDGPGIPLRHRDRVFEMFQTLKSKDEVDGSGMGLSIVKKLVERYGGTISIAPGDTRGTTFRFSWPCAGRETADLQNAA